MQQQLSVVPDPWRVCKNDGMCLRLGLLLAMLAIAGGCGRRSSGPMLPETAAGGWTLQDTSRAERKTLATYRGPGTVRVEVEDMGSSVTAFDRAQRTRAEPDTVFFYKEKYFVTVKWEGADRGALKSLLRDLENRLE